MFHKRLERKQIIKMFRYRFVYNALSMLPYQLAYKLVSRLDNLVFREMIAVQNIYLEELTAHLGKVTSDLSSLESHLEMQIAIRSRNELDAIWPYLNPRRSFESAVCNVTTHDYLEKMKESGRGVIIVMAHYGRPVRASQYLANLGFSHGLLTQTFDPELINLDREEMRFRMLGMNNLLSVNGGPWFTLQKSMAPLYKALKAGQWIIVMCDLFEGNEKSQKPIPFLEGVFSAPSGIPRLAQKTDSQLIYGVGKEDLAGTVHVDFKPLPDDPEQGLIAAFAELEKDICEYPWQWHHWNVMREAWRTA